MWKEFVICVVIVVGISLANNVTQGYTKNVIQEVNPKLDSLVQVIISPEVDLEKAKQGIQEIQEVWYARYEKLTCFIEHDELEKVETSLVAAHSLITTEQYEEASSELNKCSFVLRHIQEKNEFSLQNIF